VGTFHIGEVQFYFRSNHSSVVRAYALVSLWSEPNMDLLRDSSGTVYSCVYQGVAELRVINAKTITSSVAMLPVTPRDGDHSARFFLLEKPGLEIMASGDVSTDAADE
jgi:hypothetical protein